MYPTPLPDEVEVEIEVEDEPRMAQVDILKSRISSPSLRSSTSTLRHSSTWTPRYLRNPDRPVSKRVLQVHVQVAAASGYRSGCHDSRRSAAAGNERGHGHLRASEVSRCVALPFRPFSPSLSRSRSRYHLPLIPRIPISLPPPLPFSPLFLLSLPTISFLPTHFTRSFSPSPLHSRSPFSSFPALDSLHPTRSLPTQATLHSRRLVYSRYTTSCSLSLFLASLPPLPPLHPRTNTHPPTGTQPPPRPAPSRPSRTPCAAQRP
ncbi:hypothetical protein B0H12DRAFT_1244761 [Mycena haematopus]|nr:hypothetical protein B0H12DRAFT_1244761 [Mycena haematopus]